MPVPTKTTNDTVIPSVNNNGPDSSPEVTALATGGFAIGWTTSASNGPPNFGFNLNARVATFAASGQFVDSPFIAGSPQPAEEFDVALAGLGDGSFVATWVLETGSFPNFNGDIHARFFDPNQERQRQAFSSM